MRDVERTGCERYVGRLAPSPTGALHLGNARTFLIAWLRARSLGGRLILRIEDLEHPKVKPGTVSDIIDDLRWLGLDWDEGPDVGGSRGPYVQSQRQGLYQNLLKRLESEGRIYPCICRRADVEAAQAAPHAGEDLRYPGTCRGRFASMEEARKVAEGRDPAWRFRVAPGPSRIEDGFLGPDTADLEKESGDFVIGRDRAGAGYQLAVVADDAAMGVTEVVRGDDLRLSMHRQAALARTLNRAEPAWLHVPLVVGPDGRRLAKRHGDTRLSSLRALGMSPGRVVGWLAWTGGWNPGREPRTARELVATFRLNTLDRRPVVYRQADL